LCCSYTFACDHWGTGVDLENIRKGAFSHDFPLEGLLGQSQRGRKGGGRKGETGREKRGREGRRNKREKEREREREIG
jgi:hypothetical protein